MDDEIGFCPHCGFKLESESAYCPSCGSILREPDPQQYASSPNGAYVSNNMRGPLLAAFVMLVLFSVMELIGAIGCLSFNSSTYDMMDQMFRETMDQSFVGFIQEMFNVTITKEQIISQMFAMGLISLLTGAATVFTAVLCYKRTKHMVAVGACILATVLVFCTGFVAPMFGGPMGYIFNVIIGVIVALMIYVSKEQFTG